MLTGVDKQTGERLDDVNIRYQIITFLIAGHETTSGLLSFASIIPDEESRGAGPGVRRGRSRARRGAGLAADATLRSASLNYVAQDPQGDAATVADRSRVRALSREDTTLGGRYPVEKWADHVMLMPMLHRDPKVWGPTPKRSIRTVSRRTGRGRSPPTPTSRSATASGPASASSSPCRRRRWCWGWCCIASS